MVRFDGVHAFGYNSAGSEPIWMKFGAFSEYIVCRWLWLILSAIRAEARARERGEVLFLCQVINKRTTLPISGRPNYTKFAQNYRRRGSVSW